MNRVIIRLNGRNEEFVSSVPCHEEMSNAQCEFIAKQLNVMLAEMQHKGVLRKSCFASFTPED